MESIEAPQPERPMSGGEPAPGADAPAPQPQDWRQSFSWELDVNGQKVTPDSAEKAKTWLQLGHNYSQRAAELNKREAEWQQKLRQAEEHAKRFSLYQEVDDHARQNPQWWEHVQNSFQQRGQPQVDPSLAPILNPLLERLQGMEGFVQTLQQQKQVEEQQRQDQALEAEIGEIRKQYPNIDLNAVDETGRSLEFRILKHATENGIQSFRAAYRDYLHDKLVEESKAQALAQHSQSQREAAKAGVLGKTQAPTKGLRAVESVRGKSYDALAGEALRELGIA